MYTPARAWPFSTWAVLAVMWHLASEGTYTEEELARDLPAWAADQDFPWRRPQGGLPVAPAAEGFSLAATLQQHPDKRARHFLQTGTVPAAPPDSGWRWDTGEAQPLQDRWIVLLWYLPTGTLAHAARAIRGAFPPPKPPRRGPARSLQAGRPGYGGEWRTGARARTSPLCRARLCFTPRTWELLNGGRPCPTQRAGG